MGFNERIGFSLITQRVMPANFSPQLSANLSVTGTSASVTFTPLTGQNSQTFWITNTGANGAYLGWGKTTATAVASSGTPTANCHYIGIGETIVLDFTLSTGTVDTIAAIQAGGVTTLEISLGYGQ